MSTLDQLLGALRDATTPEHGPDSDVPLDVEEIAIAICVAIGGRRLPSAKNAEGAIMRRRRNERLRKSFTGRNYVALAVAENVSVRTVRRAVDSDRARGRRKAT